MKVMRNSGRLRLNCCPIRIARMIILQGKQRDIAGIGADFESWKDEEKDCFSQQRCAEEADKVYAECERQI